MKEILTERLEELGISRYELSRRLAAHRGLSAPTSVSTMVNNAFDNPDSRTYGNIADIIKVMGGEVVIRWHTVDERVAS